MNNELLEMFLNELNISKNLLINIMKFITYMPVEVVGHVACAVANKSPKQGAALCRIRINEDILKSHIHYDNVVINDSIIYLRCGFTRIRL